jgi:hypothetical protein
MIVYEGLTRTAVYEAAARLANERRGHGASLSLIQRDGISGWPADPDDI